MVARGDCDDQHTLGVDGALHPWPPASFDIVFCENENVNCDKPNTAALTGVVVVNVCLTPNDHFQATRHMEIRLEYFFSGFFFQGFFSSQTNTGGI